MIRVREIPKEKREKFRKGYLFIPKIFAYGAAIENVDLESYIRNPTKISRALKQIYGFLRVDGVFCCDKISDFKDPLQLNLAVDVIKRISIMIPTLPIACEIQGPFSQKLSSNNLIKIIETLGSAGLDIIIFRDELYNENVDLSSVANAANFFGLNPLLRIDNFDLEKHKNIIDIFGGVIVSELELLSTLRSEFGKRLGFALDLELLEKVGESQLRTIISQIVNTNPFIITTNRDVRPEDGQALIQKIRLAGEFVKEVKKNGRVW